MRNTIFSLLSVVGGALADNAANFDRDTAPDYNSTTTSLLVGVVTQISDGGFDEDPIFTSSRLKLTTLLRPGPSPSHHC